MSQYRVIDNFISEEDLVKIEQNVLEQPIFKAYDSTAYSTSTNVYDVMMNRVFFSALYPYCGYDKEYLQYFHPILDKIPDMGFLQRVSLNLTFATPNPYISDYHVDNHAQNSFTNIFYLNSNNGGTKFKDSGEIVQSKRNRLVMFPSFRKHAAVNTTDTKLRWVLNINYIAQL